MEKLLNNFNDCTDRLITDLRTNQEIHDDITKQFFELLEEIYVTYQESEDIPKTIMFGIFVARENLIGAHQHFSVAKQDKITVLVGQIEQYIEKILCE